MPKHDYVEPYYMVQLCDDDLLEMQNYISKLKEKDYVAICDVGAYGMSLSSNYNLRPKAVELLINGRNIKKIKNRQKHKDLI